MGNLERRRRGRGGTMIVESPARPIRGRIEWVSALADRWSGLANR
jgi:hypothetical protein